jgi:hypothetical protein
LLIKNACAQRAVLRDGGHTSSEILFNFAVAVARPSGSETRHLAKPPPRWLQCGESIIERVPYREEYVALKKTGVPREKYNPKV